MLKSERAIQPLARLVADEDENTSAIAADTLNTYGKRGLEALSEIVVDSKIKPIGRLRVGMTLAKQGDPRPGVMDFDWREDYWRKVPSGEYIYRNQPARISYDYWVAKYPITIAQFERFVKHPDGYSNPAWWDGLHEEAHQQRHYGSKMAHFRLLNHPREKVSWYEAIAFTRWLNSQRIMLPHGARIGYHIRLPLDDEWEKAARGADGWEYPWGNPYKPGHANMNETREGGAFLNQTTAVGMFPKGASPYGILDMAGNIWEWCLNCRHDRRVHIGTNAARWARGGSWLDRSECGRAAFVNDWKPDLRSNRLGFRLIVSIPETALPNP